MRVAVIGNSQQSISSNELKIAEEIGRTLALAGHTLLTGACGGAPGAAEDAAVEAGGKVLGYSPAISEESHYSLSLPSRRGRDTIFTGRGFKGRNVDMILSSEVVVMIGGRMGTLNEAIIALEENRPLIVMSRTRGATELVQGIVEALRPDYLDRLYFCKTALDILDRLY